MNKIDGILNFHFPVQDFVDHEKQVSTFYLSPSSNRHLKVLNEITKSLGVALIEPKTLKGIPEVYKKFIRTADSNEPIYNEFTRSELRILSYSLTYKEQEKHSIFDNPNHLHKSLKLFQNSWKDYFLSGLLNCYLSKWNATEIDSFKLLSKFLIQRIEEYKGKRQLYLSLKTNKKYFEEDKGDLELGVTIAINNFNITEATQIISLPDHWIRYPYFSGVIRAYCKKSKGYIQDKLENIEAALNQHNNEIKATPTNKLIVSEIVIQVQKSSKEIQNKVKDMAFRLVGDPGASTIWEPPSNSSEHDKAIINKAKVILNDWVTREFINVFFEKCINDDRRKRFWLRYVKHITAFKVFGPVRVYNELRADKRISQYVPERFQTVGSTVNVSAFMFELEEHRMIEFSNPGYAFYAYKKSNHRAPSFNPRYVHTVNSFRDSSMPFLVYKRGYHLHSYSEEGRLSHTDGVIMWEEVFTYWFINIMNIHV